MAALGRSDRRFQIARRSWVCWLYAIAAGQLAWPRMTGLRDRGPSTLRVGGVAGHSLVVR
jgi:hypothetical protein